MAKHGRGRALSRSCGTAGVTACAFESPNMVSAAGAIAGVSRLKLSAVRLNAAGGRIGCCAATASPPAGGCAYLHRHRAPVSAA